MAQGLPVSNVVNVDIIMSPSAATGRNFGSLLILGTSTVIPITERVRLYSSLADIGNDFGVSSPEYLAATPFFGQSPKPTQVYIGRWAKTLATGETGEAETALQAVNAALGYTNWYGLELADSDTISDTDILSVAGAIEASTVSRVFGVTTAEPDALVSTATDDIAAKLKAANYSHFRSVLNVKQVRICLTVRSRFHCGLHG